jgi:lauroyl/myristoyl acyltransferase
MQLKDVSLAVFRQRGDLLRGLMLVSIFRPAGILLPDALIWGLSYVSALAFVVLQASGRYMAGDFKSAFGVSRFVAVRMAIRTHAKRFHEFALQQKTIVGRYTPFKFPIQLEATEEARQVIEGSGAFVLAMAHFERTDAAAAMFDAQIFNGRPVYVVAYKHPKTVLMPHPWRTALQLRQLLRATESIRPQGLEFVYLGGATNTLVDRLANEKCIVAVNIDAHWAAGRSSSLTRPFAGSTRRTFSTGAAKLARLADKPIVLGLPVMADDSRSVRLRLMGPFHSAAASPATQDAEVTQQILDVVEREIGTRPCDYMLDIGGERSWDPHTQSWHQSGPQHTMAALGAGPG